LGVTQWVDDPTGGRERGPVALARAWATAMLRPRQLFRSAVAPADQAPGLVFAAAIVLVAETTRIALVADAYPVMGGQPLASAVLYVAFVVVLFTPAALHLVAALQTVILMAVVEERAGVSETVQVIAYATAPCLFAGLPYPGVRVLATAYGAVLFVLGLSEIHDVSLPTSVAVGAVPAALVFGYVFRGFGALATLVDAVA
jgi:hypothetical protein